MFATDLVWITPDAEQLLGYITRVSNPANQQNPDVAGLIRYCASNAHWSPFEMVSACFEITTSRAIARQILRHRSFSFQEFSQRYQSVDALDEAVVVKARRQDHKNRQASHDDLDWQTRQWFASRQADVASAARDVYRAALELGIAKECARAVLPEGLTASRLYMAGTLRSWIHYTDLRAGNGTQLEHQEIARAIRARLARELPTVAAAFDWTEEGV